MVRERWEVLVPAEQLFVVAFISTLVIKLALAALIPITGDEAYFYIWGKYPDLGHYDHPPLVGWLLTAMNAFGAAIWWLRLPSVLLGSFIGWGIYRLLRNRGRELAAMAGTIFLLAPVSWYNVLITTDTPLIFFSFLSVWCLQRALKSENSIDYLLAGAFLGLAFFSKYFAVFLGFGYLVFFLSKRRDAKGIRGFLLLLTATIPFIALHLYWNYTHCWTNILFNFLNRHGRDEGGLGGVLSYLGIWLYLAAPLLFYGVRRWRKTWKMEPFSTALWIPLGLFLLLSVKVSVGLHWVLAFYPLMFLIVPPVLNRRQLHNTFRFMLALSLLHALLLGALALTPLDVWKSQRPVLHHDLVFGLETERFTERMLPYAGEYTLATHSYARSAMLEYYTGQRVIVLGGGSKHAREDDFLTDFRELDGANILLLHRYQDAVEYYKKYFADTTVEHLQVEGTDAWLIFGRGFDFQRYYEEELLPIKERYYAIPSWLPTGACGFLERYWPEEWTQ